MFAGQAILRAIDAVRRQRAWPPGRAWPMRKDQCLGLNWRFDPQRALAPAKSDKSVTARYMEKVKTRRAKVKISSRGSAEMSRFRQDGGLAGVHYKSVGDFSKRLHGIVKSRALGGGFGNPPRAFVYDRQFCVIPDWRGTDEDSRGVTSTLPEDGAACITHCRAGDNPRPAPCGYSAGASGQARACGADY